MATRTLITRRDGKPLSLSDTDFRKIDTKFRLVGDIDFIFMDLDKTQINRLEKLGYRIKELPEPEILQIAGYRINIEKNPPKVEKDLDITRTLARRWVHFLVQLVGPPNPNWVHKIEELGFDVVEKVSRYGLFVIGQVKNLDALRELKFVAWADYFKPAYRVSPNLAKQKGTIEHISVRAIGGDISATIKRWGGKIHDTHYNHHTTYYTYLITAKKEVLYKIARHPYVRALDYTPPDELTDERSNQIVAEDLDGVGAPNTGPNVNYLDSLADFGVTGGPGQIIAICDSGVCTHNNTTMQGDIAGKLSFFVDISGGAETTDENGHGTHVAGIATGNGSTGDTDPQGFLLGQGVAPLANLGSINAIGTGGSSNIQTRVTGASDNGATIMNNSWGGAENNGYSLRCSDLDGLVRDPLDDAADMYKLAVVFATANEGPGSNSSRDPNEAKNIISVGNSLNFRPGEGDVDDIRGLRASSSRGPCQDGRLLPHVVAPGTDIISSRPDTDGDPGTPGQQRPRTAYTDTGGTLHTEHYRNSGTSMAAPHVSGACALLIEWWRDRTNGKDPSQAMLKALLINGAIDIAGGPSGRTDGTGAAIPLANIPNNDQGWGRISLQNMFLQAPDSDRGPKIFSDQRHAFTATGQSHTIRVAPEDTSRPMRITLVWTDVPGGSGANPALVNDLDLEVTELDTGNLYRGNNFTNGFSTTGGAADGLNNTECVYIENPTGIYEVRIVAASVTTNARPPFDLANPWQDFAYVADNAVASSDEHVSVVPVIDRSSSMITYGYVDMTRDSSKNFIDLLGIDDQLGVVSFGTTPQVEYSDGANLQDITGAADLGNARTAVDDIDFGGLTFMGGGIQEAQNLLTSDSYNKAMIVFSDGYDNRAYDASNPWATDVVAGLPADISAYTCAMGPTSDQELLANIAEDTDARYYYMPTIDDLYEIYNYIRGAVTGDSIIVNESSFASTKTIPAWVDSGARTLTFSVAWFDKTLAYTDKAPRSSRDISVVMQDPNGKTIVPNASFVYKTIGENYVIFKIDEPVPGNWKVTVSTKRAGHSAFTIGGFVDSDLSLDLYYPAIILKAKDFFPRIPFTVRDKDQLITGFKAHTILNSPRHTPAYLLKKYNSQLRKIRIPKSLAAESKGIQDQIKLNLLNQRMIKARQASLFQTTITTAKAGLTSLALLRKLSGRVLTRPGRITSPSASLRDVVSGVSPSLSSLTKVGSTKLGKAKIAGSHNVIIEVSGYSPVSNTKFVRKELVSLVVK